MNMSCPPPSLSLFHTLPYTHVLVPVLEIYYILTLVLRTRCPPLRRPVPRPGGVVVLQCLHRLVQDIPLVRRLLLLVLQVLQVPDSLRLRFRSHATDDKPASMGINGAFLVNTPLRVSTPTLATPAVAASGHHGALIQVASHVCATQLPDTIPR